MYALHVFNLFYLYSENALDTLLLISSQCHIQGLHNGNLKTGHDGRIYTMVIIKSEVAQSCLTLCEPMDCSPPGSSILGIFQARVLQWVAISFSRESSRPGIKPSVLHCRQMLYHLSHQGIPIIKHYKRGNPLAAQWLGFHISTAGSMALIPGRGTKIPRASGSKKKPNTKPYK